MWGDLELLKKFYVVAKMGTVTKAAKILNMSQSSLSRSIDLFEHNMKGKVFIRSKTGMILNAQGERIFAHADKYIPLHEAFFKGFFENENQISGEINIVAYPYIAADWLVDVLDNFKKDYPEVVIKIHVDPDNVNPINYDIGIGTYIPNQPHLIQKEIFPTHTYFFASPKYLEEYGRPLKPDDLMHHNLIIYGGQDSYSSNRSINLLLNIGCQAFTPPRKSSFEINSLTGMINAALKGYGIAELPNYSKIMGLDLERVLPDIQGDNIPLYFIYQENRKNSKKIQALYNYIMENNN